MFKSFQSNISSNYNLNAQPTCTTGAWQVFAAQHKKSGKAVSVFSFDRKSLDVGGLERSTSASSQRKIHGEVIERLKKEASSLARLRHPSVLELAEPVEETRTGLMFATEPVAATLAGQMSKKNAHEDAERRGGGSGSGSRRRTTGTAPDFGLDELEIQKGMQQVAKGLEFLHESAGLVHGNLTPDAIYINGKSDWKIAALGFAGPPDTGAKPGAGPPIALSELLYIDPRLPKAVQLNLDYTSPDFVLDNSVSSTADMFSLGLIMIALYSSPHQSPVKTHGNSTTYKKIFSNPSAVPTASNNFLSSKPLPDQLKSHVLPRLITRRAANRMNARDFQQSSFFDNVLVSTLQFLDTLPAKTPNEKSQFMRGLPRILDQFSHSVLEKKLLPGLLEESKDKELLALILGNVFKIMKLLNNEGQRAFTDHVVPKLKEIFLGGAKTDRDTLKEAGLVIFLDNLNLVADNCDGKVFKDDILPIYALCLESSTSTVVDKALSCLSILLPKLDFSTIKNELFPAIAAVFAKTSSLMIKVRGLDALNTLCGGKSDGGAKNSSSILDKYTVQEKVVPLVKAIKTKEPTVMMAAQGLFTSISDICDYDFLATNVLPIVWSFSLGPLLNLEQFNRYMDLIKTISQRIQQEHTRKLRELATTTGGGEQANGTTFDDPSDLMGATTGGDDVFGAGAGQDDFSALVLGKKTASPLPNNSSWEIPSRPSAQSTPSTSQMPWASGVLQAAQSQSRAITPDTMLGSIPSLQPTAPAQPQRVGVGVGTGMPNMQAMQPTAPAANPWSSPVSPPPVTSPSMNSSFGMPAGGGGGGGGTGGAIDWSAARQAQMPTSLQPTSYMNAPLQIQGRSQQQQQQHQQQQQQQQNGQFGGFALQPPPGPIRQQSQPQLPQQQQQRQQQVAQKSGLDKYESLI